MKMRLTDLAIQALKPQEQQREYYCDQVRNFGIRISPAGTKTFFAVTGSEHNRSRVTVGRYPAMTLKEARRAAHRLEPKIGHTPSFAEARDDYLEAARQNLRPRTFVEVERHLRETFRPLSKKNLAHLSSTSIRAELAPLTPSVANHAHADLKTFLNWCEATYGIRNPIKAIPKPYKETSRDRILTDDELRHIYAASFSLPTFGRIVRTLMFLGTRKTETANFRHSWIQKEWITIPGAYTKNKHPLSLPLMPVVQRWLKSKPDLCFAGDTGRAYNGWGKHKAQLDELLGDAVEPWRLHDLRRTWATNAAKLRIPPHITERILNHRTSATETEISRIYNRYDFAAEKFEAMKIMTSYLITAVAKLD